MYKVKITLNNGYYYVKTMTENEVEEFKNALRYIGLIELWENENNEGIIVKDAVNSIEIKKIGRK